MIRKSNQNKKKTKKKYYQMKNINVLFTNDNKLKEVYHMWSMNHNKSMNKAITKIAGKTYSNVRQFVQKQEYIKVSEFEMQE